MSMTGSGFTTITCPGCQRSLPPAAQNCHFCGASLTGVARPVTAKKKIGPEPWVMTLYYIVAGYWILSGLRIIISMVIGLAAAQANPQLAMMSFIIYILIAIGVFQLALGVGLMMKWEWARAVVNIFCWIRILLALLSLYQTLLLANLASTSSTITSILFAVLDLLVAGLQIWLISETDFTYMR